jgi:hypothetical protein
MPSSTQRRRNPAGLVGKGGFKIEQKKGEPTTINWPNQNHKLQNL